MPRTTINRSISFDPALFEKMESRRGRLMMDRSEYVKRCVLKDMMAGGDMSLSEVPPSLVAEATTTNSRTGARPRRRGKK